MSLLSTLLAAALLQPLAIKQPLTDFSHEAIGLRNPAPRFTWGLEGREAPTRPGTEIRVGTVPAKGRVYVPKVDLTPGRTYAYSLFASNSLGRVSERFNGLFTTPTAALQPVRVNEVVAADDVDWFEITQL